MTYFYCLTGWLFLGFIGALINETEMYLKNITISKRNRKKYFILLISWGLCSFIVGLIHLSIALIKPKP